MGRRASSTPTTPQHLRSFTLLPEQAQWLFEEDLEKYSKEMEDGASKDKKVEEKGMCCR